MGVVVQEQGKFEEAIEVFKKAIELKPNYAGAHNNMGIAFQEYGKREEAIEAYTKAIVIKPDYADAHRSLSFLKKYVFEDPQIEQVKNLLSLEGVSDADRCSLNFTLAKMYDDIGELNKAFKHLSDGNALRKRLLSYSINQDKDFFTKLKKTQPLLLKNSLQIKQSSNDPSPIFILGMPRSGTTLVEQIISSHSKITGGGELNYTQLFSFKLASEVSHITTSAISKFRKKYLSELAKLSKGNHFVTDKMPQNFRFVPLICATFPEAKIIHVQRNAAATCWSNYKNYFALKGLGYSYDLHDVVSYYELYTDLMKCWQSQYDERIYNLDYEKLTSDQENETRKLIKFLELNWEEACLSPHKNKRIVRTASHQQVRQKVYKGSSEAWRKYERHLNGAFDNLLAS